MFPNDPQVVTLVAEVFFVGFHVHFPLFTHIILIFFAVGTTVEKTAIEFMDRSGVRVVTVHQIGADANFADVIACMEKMDPLHFHEIIHPKNGTCLHKKVESRA